MRIALFQPDIPQNTGNILRLGACFDIHVDIIGPTGFRLDDKRIRRSAMDYIENVNYKQHLDWKNFYEWTRENNFNLILGRVPCARKKYDIALFLILELIAHHPHSKRYCR